jgi:hypothetical protein
MPDKEKEITLLSIDAWRDGPGWNWNQWFKVAMIPLSICDLSPRKLLTWLRSEGYLGSGTAGKVAIEDDGYNIVILARGTREPLFALAYGEVAG